MGMQRMFNVSCDVKDCYEIYDGSEWYASRAREVAKADGWRRSHGKDICPAHEHEKVDALVFA